MRERARPLRLVSRRLVALSAYLFPCLLVPACDAATSTAPEHVVPPGTGGAGHDTRPDAPDGQAAPTPDAADTGATPVPPTPPDVEAGDPHVQLIGRFDRSEPSGPKCAWPGCRIVARVDARAVSARLEELDAGWMDGAPSEWDVSVDGVITKHLVMAPGVASYELASGLSDGSHLIELYKRSEAQNGKTRLVGLDLHGGALLAPPVRKARRIEIISDSALAGFGVEAAGVVPPGTPCPGIEHGARWQNFRKSAGAVLGDLVGAEVYGSVYSGKGIAKNIWHPDREPLPTLFLRTTPVEPKSSWDFSSWQPHAVVVMAGGNDFAIGKPVDQGPATLAEFTAAYLAFAEKLRQVYPSALLVLAVSPSVSDEHPEGRFTRTNVVAGVHAVVAARRAAGDTRIEELAPRVSAPEEMTGCMGHGSPAFHQRVAAELAAFLRPRLGW